MAGIFASLNITVSKDLLNEVRKALSRRGSGDESTTHAEHGHGHEESTFKHAHLGMCFLLRVLTTVSFVNFHLKILYNEDLGRIRTHTKFRDD